MKNECLYAVREDMMVILIMSYNKMKLLYGAFDPTVNFYQLPSFLIDAHPYCLLTAPDFRIVFFLYCNPTRITVENY